MVTLRGLAQVNLFADGVAAARDWYTSALGLDPYFQRPDEAAPAYVEYRIGAAQDELGIVSAAFRAPDAADEPGGAIARWHVDDIATTVDDLIARSATVWEPLIEREGGFATASVLDPFGNVVGLIHSPHYAAQAASA